MYVCLLCIQLFFLSIKAYTKSFSLSSIQRLRPTLFFCCGLMFFRLLGKERKCCLWNNFQERFFDIPPNCQTTHARKRKEKENDKNFSHPITLRYVSLAQHAKETFFKWFFKLFSTTYYKRTIRKLVISTLRWYPLTLTDTYAVFLRIE